LKTKGKVQGFLQGRPWKFLKQSNQILVAMAGCGGPIPAKSRRGKAMGARGSLGKMKRMASRTCSEVQFGWQSTGGRSSTASNRGGGGGLPAKGLRRGSVKEKWAEEA